MIMPEASVQHFSLPCHRQRGIVLVMVLWVITLLSVMAASFSYSMRSETTLASHSMGRAQARALAEAGVNYAVLNMLSNSAAQAWPADGSVRDWQFGGGQLRIAIADVGGKIDLNRADRQLLRGLLATAGGVPEEALDALLDAIQDWRDADDARLLNGAEAEDYLAAGLAPPKNAPFESVEELQGVLGMTTEIYQGVAPELTVYSNQNGINPVFASATVLKAIPDIDPQIIDDYIALRTESYAEKLPAPPSPELGSYLSAAKGVAYHIKVKSHLETGAGVVVEAVVVRQGRFFRTRAWHEG